jgi:hypothetical protein
MLSGKGNGLGGSNMVNLGAPDKYSDGKLCDLVNEYFLTLFLKHFLLFSI